MRVQRWTTARSINAPLAPVRDGVARLRSGRQTSEVTCRVISVALKSDRQESGAKTVARLVIESAGHNLLGPVPAQMRTD